MTNIKKVLLSMLPRSSTSGAAKNLTVRLERCSRQPATPVERLAVSLLSKQGAMPLDRLAQRVASDLYSEELRRGASILDIGLFGSRLFIPEVIGEIEARNGSLWRIEQPKDG